jgi:hypothetical protein
VNPKGRNPEWPPLGYEDRETIVGCVRVKVLHVSRATSERNHWEWRVFFAPPGQMNYDTPHTDGRQYKDPTKAQSVAQRWARKALESTLAKFDKGTWKELVDEPGTDCHFWRPVRSR